MMGNWLSRESGLEPVPQEDEEGASSHRLVGGEASPSGVSR